MIRIDEERIYAEIESRKPAAVALSAPDGIFSQLESITATISSKYGIHAFIMGDACYGSCDTTNDEVSKIGADLAFNIGHSISIEKLGKNTVMIDAFDDISFDTVILKSIDVLKSYERIALSTFSQHIHKLHSAAELYRKHGIDARIGKGKGQLGDGQIFGCEFYPVYDLKEEVNAFVMLGQSNFHALGVSLSTEKPTFMLDPYEDEVTDVSKLSEERLKRSILSIYKARDAERFGLIVGLREGQFMLNQTLALKKKLEERGKTVELIALRDITNDRLSQMRRIDAFIQTACPRISIDGYTFDRPVLSVPQADGLLRVLDGKELGDFLMKPNWL